MYIRIILYSATADLGMNGLQAAAQPERLRYDIIHYICT